MSESITPVQKALEYLDARHEEAAEADRCSRCGHGCPCPTRLVVDSLKAYRRDRGVAVKVEPTNLELRLEEIQDQLLARLKEVLGNPLPMPILGAKDGAALAETVRDLTGALRNLAEVEPGA